MKLKSIEKNKQSFRHTANRALSKPKPSNKGQTIIKNLQTTDLLPSSTRLSSKAKPEIKSTAYNIQQRKKFLKVNPNNRHSISSKEDVDKHNNKLKTSTVQMGNSNCVLPTNYTDNKEEDKKKSGNKTNKNDEMSMGSIQHLGNLFRISNLKKTIIIDNEGNNNLNLNLNFFNSNVNVNNNGNIKNKLDVPVKSFIQPNKGASKESEHDNNLKINDIISEKSMSTKNMDNEPKEEENRLKEYGMIFNLLNNNIEQMKNMLATKKPQNSIFKEQPSPTKNKTSNNNNCIISDKDREEINKIEAFPLTPEPKPNAIPQNSFLDSCIQDDFYQSLVKVPVQNTNASFEFSSLLSINDISNLNTNLDQTECENDEKNINLNVLRKNALNPHFLLNSKRNSSSGNIKVLKKKKNIFTTSADAGKINNCDNKCNSNNIAQDKKCLIF